MGYLKHFMFFYLGENCPVKSLQPAANNIFLDKGWESILLNGKRFFYKGYSLECTLSEKIHDIINDYKPAGKWIVISENKKVFHPDLRGFPIYSNNTDITNIPLNQFSYVRYQTRSIQPPDKKITMSEASEKINDILTENVNNFFKFNKDIDFNVLFSGGVDSLTCWALIENLGYNYVLHVPGPLIDKTPHKKTFNVVTEYESDLLDICKEKFWGYRMINCFNRKNYFATGFYSERFQLREVTTGHAMANFLGKKLHEIPNDKQYLYYFLQRENNKINNTPTFNDLESLMNWCNETIFYDHQIWHMDNNFHFCPFFDIRITEVINQLDFKDIVDNAMDAQIQKNVILKNKPEFLSLLSDYKNEGKVWQNFKKNFHNIRLNNVTSKNINI